MSKVKNFLNSYIVVIVESINPEKFLNIASKHNINLWDIEKISYTTFKFKMIPAQYKYLREIARKTHSKIKIIKKYGIHFIAAKAEKRKFFVLGIAVFTAILIYFSSIVWNINIYGNKKIDTGRIYDALKKAGLTEGKLKYKISLREIETKVTKEIDEISIINIKFEGTVAKVQIVERTMPPVLIAQDVPCDIAASKDAIIVKISALKGQANVKVGQYIKKDQILIAGVLKDNNDVPIKLVHAIGDVTGKTWYESIKETSINYKYEERTGKLKKKIYIKLLGKTMCIKNDNIDFIKYDKIVDKKRISLKNYNLPAEEITEYYYEKTDKYKTISYDEAIKISIDEAKAEINKNIPQGAKITETKIEKQLGSGIAKARVLVIAEENIGVQKIIK